MRLLPILIALGEGLQAPEQTLLSSQPRVLNSDILLRLQAPRTLIAFASETDKSENAPLLSFLENQGHHLTTWIKDKEGTPFNGPTDYLYDTVFVIGDAIPRSTETKGGLTAKRLVDFYDASFMLPDSQAGLPHSLIFLADTCEAAATDCKSECGSSNTMKLLARELGIDVSNSTRPAGSKCNDTILTFDGSTVATNYSGTFHRVDKRNSRVTPYWRFTESKGMKNEPWMETAAISLIDGDRSWNRAVWASSKSLCINDMEVCKSLINWATHRTNVITWSNWQVMRLEKHKEWAEYSADTAKIDWSMEELNDLMLSSPYLYRIRDELIVAIDLYQLRNFQWEPYTDNAILEIEYVMMEPWVRKLMIPFTRNKQRTRLMQSIRNMQPSIPGLHLGNATHWIHFKAPRQHGTFKLVIKRILQSVPFPDTPIWIETVAPLRTYKHNEDPPRFIPEAFAYYGSMIVSTFVFYVACIALFLSTTKEKEKEA